MGLSAWDYWDYQPETIGVISLRLLGLSAWDYWGYQPETIGVISLRLADITEYDLSPVDNQTSPCERVVEYGRMGDLLIKHLNYLMSYINRPSLMCLFHVDLYVIDLGHIQIQTFYSHKTKVTYIKYTYNVSTYKIYMYEA